MTDIKEYKDLTGLILGQIRPRPAMYLGDAKISNLSTFLIGYQMCLKMTGSNDSYFGDKGFNDWFFKKYKIETSFWETPFLEEANNDEGKALELFFEYLDEYQREKTSC